MKSIWSLYTFKLSQTPLNPLFKNDLQVLKDVHVEKFFPFLSFYNLSSVRKFLLLQRYTGIVLI